MEQRPEVHAAYLQQRTIHAQLTEVGLGELPTKDLTWKLPDSRRQTLLDLLDGKPSTTTPDAPTFVAIHPQALRGRFALLKWIAASAACLLLAATLMLSSRRSLSRLTLGKSASTSEPQSEGAPSVYLHDFRDEWEYENNASDFISNGATDYGTTPSPKTQSALGVLRGVIAGDSLSVNDPKPSGATIERKSMDFGYRSSGNPGADHWYEGRGKDAFGGGMGGGGMGSGGIGGGESSFVDGKTREKDLQQLGNAPMPLQMLPRLQRTGTPLRGDRLLKQPKAFLKQGVLADASFTRKAKASSHQNSNFQRRPKSLLVKKNLSLMDCLSLLKLPTLRYSKFRNLVVRTVVTYNAS